MVSKTLFSSETGEWETPQDLFNELNNEFNFGWDLAATKENAKCKYFFTKEQDALGKDWFMIKSAWALWCNPPYGRDIGKWVKKAHLETMKGANIVMLLPARTDTKWFHDFIYGQHGIRFLKGRLKFGGAKHPAPFPSMVVIFK